MLENLRIEVAQGIVPKQALTDAEARALGFMLAHRLYRSDRTGQDSRWNTLRALRVLRASGSLAGV